MPPPGRRRQPEPRAARRRPAGRLTAVGAAVVTLTGTVAGAVLDDVADSGRGWLFGSLYVLVCFHVAARVRPADLAAAPISGPIAFAAALLLVTPPVSSGIAGHAAGLAAGLALHAGWLFTGTGLALGIALLRRAALRRCRRP